MNKDLINKCRELVKNNIKAEINEEVFEILTYAVLGIILTNEELAIKKLPEILKDLDVYAEKKPIIDIAHERLGNYVEDNHLKTSDACVTRAIKIDDDGTVIGEKRSLLINLKDNYNFFTLVFILMHELTHLLRFGGITQNGKDYKVNDGISITRFNSKDYKLKRKYYNFEEGIVQRNTNIAAKNLFEFITEIKDDSENSKKYIKGYKKCKFDDYFITISILETLCLDKKFEELVDESFTETNTPSRLAIYFNNVMENPCAFSELNKQLDKISEYIINNEQNEKSIETTLAEIKKICTTFIQKARKYKH